jgi:hypothetical protein
MASARSTFEERTISASRLQGPYGAGTATRCCKVGRVRVGGAAVWPIHGNKRFAGLVYCDRAHRGFPSTHDRAHGQSIDEEDVANAIHDMLCLEAREAIGPLKIRRRAKKKKAPDAPALVADSAPSKIEDANGA